MADTAFIVKLASTGKKYRLLPIKQYWTFCIAQGSMFRFHADKGFVEHV
jgi:hypothetical protein